MVVSPVFESLIHAAHFSITVSYRKHALHGSRAAERLSLALSSTGAAPVSFVFCVRFKCSAVHPNIKAAVG